MVYTTHLWRFWGWFTIGFPTLYLIVTRDFVILINPLGIELWQFYWNIIYWEPLLNARRTGILQEKRYWEHVLGVPILRKFCPTGVFTGSSFMCNYLYMYNTEEWFK
jgi:hypothetical protein